MLFSLVGVFILPQTDRPARESEGRLIERGRDHRALESSRNEDRLDLGLSHLDLRLGELSRVVEEGDDGEKDRDHCVSLVGLVILPLV